MKHRSPAAVLLLPFVTFFIYPIYWYVSTKGEMNKLGANIPTAWLIIVPFVSIWWMWKYAEGVEKVTNEKTSGVLAFLLLWLLGSIGAAIIQDSFNKIEAAGVPGNAPSPADPNASAQPIAAEPAPAAVPAPAVDPVPPVAQAPAPTAEPAAPEPAPAPPESPAPPTMTPPAA